MVNDVSGGLADPAMARVVAEAGCPWILMHWRGHSPRMRELALYNDVVAEVRAELAERVDAALAAGVAADRLILDPGLGFAKRAEHNWELSARLDRSARARLSGALAASRKSYLGAPARRPRRHATTDRRAGGGDGATSVLAVAAGAWGVRVHDVRETVDALAVWRATGRPRPPDDRRGGTADDRPDGS